MITCGGCSKSIYGDQNFCGSCGTSVETALFRRMTGDLNINVVAEKEMRTTQNAFSDSYKLRDHLVSLHRKNTDVGDMEKITIIGHLNDKTIELLDGAFMLLRLNLPNASQTLIRPIIDNITTQLYLGLVETDLDNYKTKLSYEIPNQNKIKRNEKINGIQSNYKLKNMIDSLYSGNNKAEINKVVNIYNSVIHPDPRVDCKRIVKDGFLQTLALQLSLFCIQNILARLQSYHNTEYQHTVFLDTNEQLGEFLQNNSDVLSTCVPNHHDIIDNVMFVGFLKM